MAIAALMAALTRSAAQAGALKVVVIAGEDAVNVIQQKTAVAPVVEVRDRNDLPVAGATVTFSVSGKGATFGGLQTITVTTDATGRATAAGLTPIGSGSVQVNVKATYQTQTATASISQTNFMTAAQAASASGSGGGGLSTGAVIGVTSAAAAAAVVGALALKDKSATTGPSTNIAVSPFGGGIREITEFTFTVAGTSAGGLSYTWDFGDGGSATGTTASHTYASEGEFQVKATSTGNEAPPTPASVRIGSLTGTWTRPAVSGVSHRLVVVQQGSRLSNQWFINITPDSPFYAGVPTDVSALSGTVSHPRDITLEEAGGCRRFVSIGSVNEALTRMGGSGGSRTPECESVGLDLSYFYDRQ